MMEAAEDRANRTRVGRWLQGPPPLPPPPLQQLAGMDQLVRFNGERLPAADAESLLARSGDEAVGRKALLVTAVAPLRHRAGSRTGAELVQLNRLAARLADRLCVMLFPSKQLCSQKRLADTVTPEQFESHMRLQLLGPEEPLALCLMAEAQLNGRGSHPLFRHLRRRLILPCDDPDSVIAGDPADVRWAPLSRSDVGADLEKFLVDSTGRAVKRYSSRMQVEQLRPDLMRYCSAV